MRCPYVTHCCSLRSFIASALTPLRLCCRVWEGEFSSDTHMAHMLRMLDDFVYDPFDWVVSVDSDEFQEWPGMIR